jgi:hypothetical protein
VRPTAFRNTDGTFVVVINADTAGTVTVRGLPAGRYIASYTTARETARALPPIVSDGPLKVALPAAGIMTIRLDGAKSGPAA